MNHSRKPPEGRSLQNMPILSSNAEKDAMDLAWIMWPNAETIKLFLDEDECSNTMSAFLLVIFSDEAKRMNIIWMGPSVQSDPENVDEAWQHGYQGIKQAMEKWRAGEINTPEAGFGIPYADLRFRDENGRLMGYSPDAPL